MSICLTRPATAFAICLLTALSAYCKNDCSYHYFKNRKVSTSQCYDGNRFGKAIAYNKSGKVIYEKELRRVAGHSSVYFSYYPSGAVSKAEWSSAPDAGIQWYRSVTTFDEAGNITSFTEQSNDDRPGITVPHTLLKERPQETVACAAIYSSEFWFINGTAENIVVHADRLNSTDDFHTIMVKPGDTVKAGSMIQAEHFDNPDKYYNFTAELSSGKNNRSLIIKPAGAAQVAVSVKRYYYNMK